MLIEIDEEAFDVVVKEQLLWHYNMFKDMLDTHPQNPYFSKDQKEDRKHIKKMVKALKRVHNYYAPPSEELQ